MTSEDALLLMKNLKRAWHPHTHRRQEPESKIAKKAYHQTMEAVALLKPLLDAAELQMWEHWISH